MSTQPYDQNDILQLISFFKGATHEDNDQQLTGPQRYYGNHTFVELRVTNFEQRAPHLRRVWFEPQDNGHHYEWDLANVSLRLEIPVPPAEFEGIDGAPTTASRAYTVAEYDPSTGQFAVDFVTHGTNSPVMQWLACASIGESIWSWEPGQHRVPGTCQRLLLVADSTALPAALSILRDHHVFEEAILITSAAPAERDHNYPFLDDITVHHTSAEPGALAHMVTTQQWECDWVWACGETAEMKPIRTTAKTTWGIPKERLQVFGYWRRDRSGTDSDIARLIMVRDGIMNGESVEAVEARFEEEL